MDFKDYIIQNTAGNLYWKDKNGNYLGCNLAFSKISGLGSPEEIKGKSDKDLFLDLLGEEGIKKLISLDQEVIQNDLEKVAEEIGINEHGEIAYYITKKLPLKNEKGEIIGLVGTSIDITEVKILEKKLIESHASEERLKVLSSMGGMIAHELRTPLAGMTFGINTIEKKITSLASSIEDKNIQILLNVCNEMQLSLVEIGNTIDTILAGFSPNMVSKEKLENIDITKLLKDFMCRFPFTEKELGCVHINHDKSYIAKGVPQVISYILSNLVKNALYFIKEVNKGKITIWADQQDDCVRIHVKDTAKGIPKNRLTKIFEPLYTTKDSATSIGMGLYFCKLAIESLRGTIHCDSIEGEYTEFTISLPSAH